MPAAEDLSVGPDGSAQGGEGGLGDDGVVVGREHEHGKVAAPELRQLGSEVGGPSQRPHPDETERVVDDVVDDVVTHGEDHLDAFAVGEDLSHDLHPPYPDGAIGDTTHRVQEHEVADPLGMVVGELGGDTPSEGVTDDEGGLLDADHAQEAVDPVGVAGDRHGLPRQLGRATEPGQGRREDAASPSRQAADGTPVGPAPEGPAMEEDDRGSRPSHAIACGAAVDIYPVPGQGIVHDRVPVRRRRTTHLL